MKIGQVASKVGVHPATIRYYEQRGLITEVRRSASGYRQYGDETVNRLRFIKRAQRAGFSLEDICELLELYLHDTGACPQVQTRARQKMHAIKEQIRDLEQTHRLLEVLVATCTASGTAGDCPLLTTLIEGIGPE
jgi:MerR family mercuric resistance operon transcriptional regulator